VPFVWKESMLDSDANLSPAIPIDPPDGYPRDLSQDVELPDGTLIHIRPVVPADVDRIRHAFAVGDAESIRRRFLTGAPPSDESHLHYLVELDYIHRLALVGLDDEGDSIGIARYEGMEGGDSAEIAIVVVPEWRKRGIGRILVEALEAPARDAGIRRFVAAFQPDNRPIASLLADIGYGDRWYEDGLAWVAKPLQ
jgi:GNAT superfamily N-acetyltransferase